MGESVYNLERDHIEFITFFYFNHGEWNPVKGSVSESFVRKMWAGQSQELECRCASMIEYLEKAGVMKRSVFPCFSKEKFIGFTDAAKKSIDRLVTIH